MPYLGNTAASRFVSNRAASVYSGDGSTVAFTLEQVVTQDEDILVSVDGVIQEPSVGYAVSSGTTLTFTAAPSTNSGNNIFVYYLASQAGTVGHPSTQALSATVGTFSSNATVGGTLGVTGATTLTGATALGNTGSTVKSEGGAVTTNIAQGLAKQWSRVSGAGMSVSDSFNTSSVTDSATGKAAPVFTSNMGGTVYNTVFGGDDKQDGGGVFVVNINDAVTQATTGYGFSVKKQSASAIAFADLNQNGSSTVFGDLA